MKNWFSKNNARVLVTVILLTAMQTANSAVFTVNSESAFNTAQSSASTGDTIVWKNGTYSDINLGLSKSGLTVRAETSGGVIFTGGSLCGITGDNIVFKGFQYKDGDIGSGYIVIVEGSHNILTQLNFNGYLAKKYISIAAGSQFNEVSYCNFENKPVAAVIGCTIQINTSATVPGYHKIRYCSFQNYPGAGGDNGNEPVRIGLGAESTNTARNIVEYCYFNNTGLGDGENISLKCCENVVRYCTFDNNPLGMLVFRNGNRNVAYGNFFINGSGGIRVKEANDIYCYNNYFETSGISGTGGTKEAINFTYVSPNLKNINFIHNTFIECGDITLGGTGPTNVTFANNIFKKSSGDIFVSDNGQTAWSGNIYSGTLGITIASGMTKADPLLVKNSDNYFELSSLSPAIDKASASYPAILDIANVDDDPSILMDISGQPRPADKLLKDIGCDESTTGSIINRPLKLANVGPSYLIATSISHEVSMPVSLHLNQNYPNPFNPSTQITFAVQTSGKALVKVVDVLGNEVATIFNAAAEAGREYSVSFNASSLSSGIYFYRLECAGQSVSRKMLLLK